MSKIYTIGRKNSKRADILIDNSTVSSVHAQVWYDDYSQSFWIEDLKSTNHTYIIQEGERKKVNFPCKISPVDIVVLGEKQIAFSYFIRLMNLPKNEQKENKIEGMRIERCRVCGSPKKVGQPCNKC